MEIPPYTFSNSAYGFKTVSTVGFSTARAISSSRAVPLLMYSSADLVIPAATWSHLGGVCGGGGGGVMKVDIVLKGSFDSRLVDDGTRTKRKVVARIVNAAPLYTFRM